MRTRVFKVALWLIATTLPCILAAQAAPPAPAELIARAIAAREAQGKRDWKYTYREDHTQRQLEKDGTAGLPFTKTYEHIMLEGAEYRKLILVDGKPLDAKAQKKVDEDLEKSRVERKKRGFLSVNRTVSLGTLDLLPRLFNNKVTGEETIAGRKAWRMESEPKTDYKAANKEEEQAMASRRVSWFDQENGVHVKEDSVFIRATNSFQPGTTIDVEYTQVGADWLPGTDIMRANMKIVLGIHGRVESTQRYYDYKRFTVDSRMTPQ